MVSKSQIKLITSLSQKKYRQQHGLFVVEGLKGISEFLESNFALHSLFALEGFFTEEQPTEVTLAELKKISFLKTPQKALALFEIPEDLNRTEAGFQLILDDVRDPGNLGTLIRLCDWYGIKNLVEMLRRIHYYIINNRIGVYQVEIIRRFSIRANPIYNVFTFTPQDKVCLRVRLSQSDIVFKMYVVY